MKIVTIAVASAVAISSVAMSAIAPAFAYENDLESVTSTSTMHQMHQMHRQHAGMHANAHRAFDARAYAPAPAPVSAPNDFGIGSQS